MVEDSGRKTKANESEDDGAFFLISDPNRIHSIRREATHIPLILNPQSSILPKVICIMGPTGSGKSALAITMANEMDGEIISVDSAQVYRGMDIGTAKPSKEEQAQIPHHLIDIRDPKEPYSAADFRLDAIDAINDILSRGKQPLLVGGTMLYFKALQQGLSPMPSANKNVREKIKAEAEKVGWQKLHERLEKIDPKSAKRIHPNDPQRMMRALEVYEISGKTLTEWFEKDSESGLTYSFINIVISPIDRATLYHRLEKRFDRMLANGFIEEVKRLYDRGDLTPDLPSIRSVGYRQAWDYLAGKIDYQTMREKAITATRQLAKRQMTAMRSWKLFSNYSAPCHSKLRKTHSNAANSREK